ncbi:hypothetical protein GCM10023322_28030 [Rugosimonospora acidiphila]|uniref:Uncharacterized protein n=1 Tax=Rugosimonospora acidiphila TaxID=556531 RepID=A0ABP9RQY3_9ACTN
MASAAETAIRVEYNYLRRQRDDWHDLAPDVGKIAGLLQQLAWRGQPAASTDLPSGDLVRGAVRALAHVTNPQWISDWQARQVTFLRPVLEAHQQVADWAQNRAVEGWTAQNNIAETLSEILDYYETETTRHQALLRTVGRD